MPPPIAPPPLQLRQAQPVPVPTQQAQAAPQPTVFQQGQGQAQIETIYSLNWGGTNWSAPSSSQLQSQLINFEASKIISVGNGNYAINDPAFNTLLPGQSKTGGNTVFASKQDAVNFLESYFGGANFTMAQNIQGTSYVGPTAQYQAASSNYNILYSSVTPTTEPITGGSAYSLNAGGQNLLFGSQAEAASAAYSLAFGSIYKTAPLSLFSVGGNVYGSQSLAQGAATQSAINLDVGGLQPVNMPGIGGAGFALPLEYLNPSQNGAVYFGSKGEAVSFITGVVGQGATPSLFNANAGGMFGPSATFFTSQQGAQGAVQGYYQGQITGVPGGYSLNIGGQAFKFTSLDIGKEFVSGLVSGSGSAFSVGGYTFGTQAEASSYGQQLAIDTAVANLKSKGYIPDVLTITPAMVGSHSFIDLGYGPMKPGTYIVGSLLPTLDTLATEQQNASLVVALGSQVSGPSPISMPFVGGIERNELGNIVGRTTANETAASLVSSYGGAMPIVSIGGQPTVRGIEGVYTPGNAGPVSASQAAALTAEATFLSSPLGKAYSFLATNPEISANPFVTAGNAMTTNLRSFETTMTKGLGPGAAAVVGFPLGVASGVLNMINVPSYGSQAANLLYAIGNPGETVQGVGQELSTGAGQGWFFGNIAGAVIGGKVLGEGIGYVKNTLGTPQKVTLTGLNTEAGKGEPFLAQQGARWVMERPQGFTVSAVPSSISPVGEKITGGLERQPLIPEPTVAAGQVTDYATFKGFMKTEIANYNQSIAGDIYGFKGTTQGSTLIDIKANAAQIEDVFSGKGAFVENPELRAYFTETRPELTPNLLTEAKEALPETLQEGTGATGKVTSFSKATLTPENLPTFASGANRMVTDVIGFATKTGENEEELWGANLFNKEGVPTARPYASPYEGTPLSETQAAKISSQDLRPTALETGGTAGGPQQLAQLSKELTGTREANWEPGTVSAVRLAEGESFAAQGIGFGAAFGISSVLGSASKSKIGPMGIESSAFSLGSMTSSQFKTSTRSSETTATALKPATAFALRATVTPDISQVLKPAIGQLSVSALNQAEMPALKLSPSLSFIQQPAEMPAFKTIQELIPSTAQVYKQSQKEEAAGLYVPPFSALNLKSPFVLGPQQRHKPGKSNLTLGSRYWEQIYGLPKLSFKANTTGYFGGGPKVKLPKMGRTKARRRRSKR